MTPHPAQPSALRDNCPPLSSAGQPGRPAVGPLWTVLLLTGGFMIVEAVGGWVSGSLALLADAGHMLTDVGALGLSLLTAWIARRPADDSKTYGYL
ncbi:MAG: cation transporter, partial [Gemmatimonadales bacterium]